MNIVASVPTGLASQLESLARSQRVSFSALVRDMLSLAICGKPVEHQPRGNRDGMDDAARAYIKANCDMTVAALVKLLSDNGIKRGKTWVAEARLETTRRKMTR